MAQTKIYGVPYHDKWVVGPCETEEIAERVLEIGNDAGYQWSDFFGQDFLINLKWNSYKEKTCYDIIGGELKSIDDCLDVVVISPKEFIEINEANEPVPLHGVILGEKNQKEYKSKWDEYYKNFDWEKHFAKFYKEIKNAITDEKDPIGNIEGLLLQYKRYIKKERSLEERVDEEVNRIRRMIGFCRDNFDEIYPYNLQKVEDLIFNAGIAKRIKNEELMKYFLNLMKDIRE